MPRFRVGEVFYPVYAISGSNRALSSERYLSGRGYDRLSVTFWDRRTQTESCHKMKNRRTASNDYRNLSDRFGNLRFNSIKPSMRLRGRIHVPRAWKTVTD